MWKSILAQSVEELCLGYLGECFVWPSLQFFWFYWVLLSFFFLFFPLELKKDFNKLTLV